MPILLQSSVMKKIPSAKELLATISKLEKQKQLQVVSSLHSSGASTLHQLLLPKVSGLKLLAPTYQSTWEFECETLVNLASAKGKSAELTTPELDASFALFQRRQEEQFVRLTLSFADAKRSAKSSDAAHLSDLLHDIDLTAAWHPGEGDSLGKASIGILIGNDSPTVADLTKRQQAISAIIDAWGLAGKVTVAEQAGQLAITPSLGLFVHHNLAELQTSPPRFLELTGLHRQEYVVRMLRHAIAQFSPTSIMIDHSLSASGPFEDIAADLNRAAQGWKLSVEGKWKSDTDLQSFLIGPWDELNDHLPMGVYRLKEEKSAKKAGTTSTKATAKQPTATLFLVRKPTGLLVEVVVDQDDSSTKTLLRCFDSFKLKRVPIEQAYPLTLSAHVPTEGVIGIASVAAAVPTPTIDPTTRPNPVQSANPAKSPATGKLTKGSQKGNKKIVPAFNGQSTGKPMLPTRPTTTVPTREQRSAGSLPPSDIGKRFGVDQRWRNVKFGFRQVLIEADAKSVAKQLASHRSALTKPTELTGEQAKPAPLKSAKQAVFVYQLSASEWTQIEPYDPSSIALEAGKALSKQLSTRVFELAFDMFTGSFGFDVWNNGKQTDHYLITGQVASQYTGRAGKSLVKERRADGWFISENMQSEFFTKTFEHTPIERTYDPWWFVEWYTRKLGIALRYQAWRFNEQGLALPIDLRWRDFAQAYLIGFKTVAAKEPPLPDADEPAASKRSRAAKASGKPAKRTGSVSTSRKPAPKVTASGKVAPRMKLAAKLKPSASLRTKPASSGAKAVASKKAAGSVVGSRKLSPAKAAAKQPGKGKPAR